jgi:hypothetical protein
VRVELAKHSGGDNEGARGAATERGHRLHRVGPRARSLDFFGLN